MTRASLFVTLVAVLYIAGGIVLLFLPGSISSAGAGLTMSPLSAQLYGVALLGLGSGSWIARRGPLGGIYGRAIVAGNFTHTSSATMVLLRPTIAAGSPTLWIVFVVALLLATGFGWLLFVSGGIPKPTPPSNRGR